MNKQGLIQVSTAITEKLLTRFGTSDLLVGYNEPYDDGDVESGPRLVPGNCSIQVSYPEDLMVELAITEDFNCKAGDTSKLQGCELPTSKQFMAEILRPIIRDGKIDDDPFWTYQNGIAVMEIYWQFS